MARKKGKSGDRAPGIGELKERSLHAAVKRYLAEPGDRLEERFGRHVVDIVRELPPEGALLIEVQTANFWKIKPKLEALLTQSPVLLIYPVAAEKWIVHVDEKGNELSRRKSPRRGKVTDIFLELTSMGDLPVHPGLTIEVLLAKVEEVRTDDGQGSWRRKGVSITDRRLLEVVDRVRFTNVTDYQRLLPDTLDDEFTNRDLASTLRIPLRLAGRMSYCLRKVGAIREAGKSGRSLLFTRSD